MKHFTTADMPLTLTFDPLLEENKHMCRFLIPKHASCKSQPAQMRLIHNSDICVLLFNLYLTWKIPLTLQMSRVSTSIGSAATVETRGYFPWASFTDKLRRIYRIDKKKHRPGTKEKQLGPDKTSEITLGKLHSRQETRKKNFLYNRKRMDSLQLALGNSRIFRFLIFIEPSKTEAFLQVDLESCHQCCLNHHCSNRNIRYKSIFIWFVHLLEIKKAVGGGSRETGQDEQLFQHHIGP